MSAWSKVGAKVVWLQTSHELGTHKIVASEKLRGWTATVKLHG